MPTVLLQVLALSRFTTFEARIHFRTVFHAIENNSVHGIAKSLDVLGMSEMDGTIFQR